MIAPKANLSKRIVGYNLSICMFFVYNDVIGFQSHYTSSERMAITFLYTAVWVTDKYWQQSMCCYCQILAC